MLELRDYTKNEISGILGTRDKQGIDRKLQRYGVDFTSTGRGENRVYTIKNIHFPFKVFCITEMGFEANCDFDKVKNFYNHFFNDEHFMTMPDEVKERMTKQEGYHLSRQTIATYTRRLVLNNMIHKDTTNFIYYFAYKKRQRLVERTEYTQAWREYWNDIHNDLYSSQARWNMIANYGGMARKQAIPEINVVMNDKIEYMLSLIHQSFDEEIA